MTADGFPPASEPLARNVLQERPFNAEAPLAALASIPTPSDLFYVRSNFDIPRIDRAEWRLRVTGALETEREFAFDDFSGFTPTEALVVLECAGNGRMRMVPVPGGTPWDVGAVSCAIFRGIPLVDVLDACGVSPDAVEVLFVGADRGDVAPGRTISFERSLPIAKARDRSVILATEMNGEPLSAEHGYPMRLLVPGWYAVSSVKWVTEIRVLTKPFEGHFQTERYVYIDDPFARPQEPVREMRVRALVAQPADRDVLQPGAHVIRGIAWSGSAQVRSVEVSTDDGVTWNAADVQAAVSPGGPAAWTFEWDARPGIHRLLARANDAAGNTQPAQPIFNQLGYGNNVVHAIDVTVR